MPIFGTRAEARFVPFNRDADLRKLRYGCGGHWQHSANSGYHYYCCRGAMHGGDLCDNATKLRGEDLELAIVQSIERNLFSNEFLDGLVAEILELRSAYLATISDRSALQKRRDELTLEIERLTEMAAKLPDITEIANKIGGRQNERTQVDQQLATTAMPPTAINPQRLRDDVSLRLTNTLTLLKSDADVAARRIELQKWIETIRIDGNGEVWIKWKQTEFIDRIDASQIGRARKVKVLDGWSRLPPQEYGQLGYARSGAAGVYCGVCRIGNRRGGNPPRLFSKQGCLSCLCQYKWLRCAPIEFELLKSILATILQN